MCIHFSIHNNIKFNWNSVVFCGLCMNTNSENHIYNVCHWCIITRSICYFNVAFTIKKKNQHLWIWRVLMCKCHDLNYVISPYIILPLLDASGTTGAENCLGRKTVWAIDLSCSRSGASPYRLFKQIPTALTCPLQVITTIDNSFHFTTFTKKKKKHKKNHNGSQPLP